MPLRLLVSGKRACFRRPEFKRDLVTYDVITPPAARIILDRLYRPAAMHWSLDRIEIMNPIQRGWESVVGGSESRRVLALRDVAYRLVATLIDPNGLGRSDEHDEEFNRRILDAAAKPIAHLGLREFSARLAPAPLQAVGGWSDRPLDLGWMPFETGKGRAAAAHFFHAVAIAGVIDLAHLDRGSFAV